MAFHDVSNPPTEFDHALENFTRNLSQKEKVDFRFTTISDVYREIDRIQKDQESKGLLRNLRRLQPFIDGLQRYSSIIEQFVNVKPNILAFIWGPIKLFLQISSTHVKCFDIVLNALRRIGENLPRFESFENIFKGDLRIKRVLLWIYSDILEFYAEVLNFLRKKGQYMFLFALPWSDCLLGLLLDSQRTDLILHRSLIILDILSLNFCTPPAGLLWFVWGPIAASCQLRSVAYTQMMFPKIGHRLVAIRFSHRGNSGI